MSVQHICALGISPETLSSWRDNHLPAPEKARISRHISDCDACRGTLTQFEIVAHTLVRQGELDPGNRVWRGVQAHIARSAPRRAGFPAYAWRGAGATLAVLLVVALFIVTLRYLNHLQTNSSIVGSILRQTTPLPTEVATPIGTATPTSLNQPNVTQAWGPKAATLAFTIPSSSTQVFQASTVTPDGKLLLGEMLTSTGQGTRPQQQAGYIAISATNQFTPLAGMPTSGGPGCCQPDSDGRYLLATDSTAPGATGASLHVRLWVYDLQARQIWLAATGQQYPEILGARLDHGLLIFATDNGLEIVNVATKTVTQPHALATYSALVAYSWPYVFYSPISTTGQDTLRVYNLQTQADSVLGTVLGTYSFGAVTGDTLFATYQSSQGLLIYEMDHFANAGAQLHLITTYPDQSGRIVGANARVIAFQGAYPWVWDRAENHFVALSALTNQTAMNVVETLSGALLTVFTTGTSSIPPTNGLPLPQKGTLYDTSKLPLNGNPPPS